MFDTTREGAVIRELQPQLDRGSLENESLFWWWLFRIYGADRALKLAQKWEV